MRARLLGVLAAVALTCGGCLSLQEPSIVPATGFPTQAPTAPPRDAHELIVAVPGDPAGFLPPADDDTTALLVDLLYDPLYRLDEHLEPQPVLASGLPSVDATGTTWTIGLRDGVRFQDNTIVAASDVAFSLELAASPACSYGNDLCDAVQANLATAAAAGALTVSVTLNAAFSPFLGEALARIPIVSENGVRAATRSLLASASRIPPDAPGRQVTQIADATNADACLSDAPPFGCRLSDYSPALEKTLSDAGVTLPPHARFIGSAGDFQAEAYAGALYARVAALDQLLTTEGIDQQAAALPLIDLSKRALGSGPYRVSSYSPGSFLELKSNPGHVGGAPAIPRITLAVVRDPPTAATQLLTGDVDWVLHVETDQLAALRGAPGLSVGGRPLASQRTIVFNVRAGRVYAAAATRRAFALCLDRSALDAQATGGTAIPANAPTDAGSWAMNTTASPKRDPAAAIALLQGAGWTRGTDGIFMHGSQRLTSDISIRPSRTDLLAFAQAAAQQLAECGIELKVKQLDLTGDLLLAQLKWPNDFDTVLLTRQLGSDPDQDVVAFEASHATTADNTADANPGGYSSPDADRLIAQARLTLDQGARKGLYGQLQDQLEKDEPAWPIWYDQAWSALSNRISSPNGPIDPGAPRFWWNVAAWKLGPPPSGATPAPKPSGASAAP
jgi:ABC-type transport system substrate-binding protein